MKKKLAVLLSLYNGEKHVGKQVESILSQRDYYDFDLIIRNDGSSDNGPGIIQEFIKRNDNIILLNGPNIGLVGSFFSLLKYAYDQDYSFFAFSDQDDFWLPDKIATAMNAIKDIDEPCMYACCSKIVDEDLNDLGSLTQIRRRDICFYNTAIQNICPGHNQLINRKLAHIILSYTVCDRRIYVQDLWMSNVAAVSGKIVFDNEPHTLYRQHGNNQLSYGRSNLGWFKKHFNRMFNGESKKIASQLEFFVDSYANFLSAREMREIKLFFDSNSSFFRRLIYISRSKLYRQRSIETCLFRILYLLGGYKTKKA